MGLSAAEQYELELINRARLDPQAEADRYGISLNTGLAAGTISTSAKQVLAPNDDLNAAAQVQSDYLLSTDTFTHTGAGGSDPGDRMEDAGYVFSGTWSWAENLAWYGTTGTLNLEAAIEEHHQGLYESPSHRANTFAPQMREIGIAQVEGLYKYNGTTFNSSMLTLDFALSGTEVFVTGVVYRDTDKDDFYSIGEGMSGIRISAAGAGDTSEAAGGYSVGVSSGSAVAVTVTQGSTTLATLTMNMTPGNGKLDVIQDTDDSWSLALSASATLTSGIGDAVLLGVANLSLTGHGGANALTGNSGNNKLSGMDANDTLTGGGGTDTLVGGKGNDTLITDGGDTITEASGEGTDVVKAGVSYTLGANLENLTLTGSGAINGTGNGAANALAGNSGNNKLSGLDGNDTLNGFAGSDTLTGGAGADTFAFNSTLGSGNVDDITDYNVAADTIRLDNSAFTGLVDGTLASAAFASNTSGNAQDASDRIIYESDTGKIYFDRDGTGSAAKVLFAEADPGLTMTNADFLII